MLRRGQQPAPMTAKARCALQNAVINWEDRLFPLVSDPHPRFSRSHSSKLPQNPCRLISLRFSIDRIAAYGGIVEANWATAGRAQVAKTFGADIALGW